MALLAILHKAGVAIVRVPLLWFFSIIALITSMPELSLNDSLWSCLSLISFPIAILAQAGQIRSVQLYHADTPASLSEIIRYGVHKFGPLLAVLVISVVIILPFAAVLGFVLKSLLPQMSRPELMINAFRIASLIIYPFITFAQCAIVISGFSVGSSFPMVLRALKKDAFTVIALVVVFGLINFFFSITYTQRVMGANLGITVVYYAALLIVTAVQSAVFTYTYFYTIGDVHKETTTSS